ncbi:MAG: hypothetical protein N2B03_06230 [Boseongicola sp.]
MAKHTHAHKPQPTETAKADAVVCVIIHAVFARSAYEDILAAGAARIVTTDTITHRSNAVSVAGIIAKAIPPIVPSSSYLESQ